MTKGKPKPSIGDEDLTESLLKLSLKTEDNEGAAKTATAAKAATAATEKGAETPPKTGLKIAHKKSTQSHPQQQQQQQPQQPDTDNKTLDQQLKVTNMKKIT